MGDLAQATSLILQFPFLSPDAAERLVHLYGRNKAAIFEDVVAAIDDGMRQHVPLLVEG
ncbi:hypothetical protein [Celeribacter sp.]|uniref:hypothetical protein n=1 Tax=Celeribacter sp. TaxID=1890673 RepID=UPI003A935ECE